MSKLTIKEKQNNENFSFRLGHNVWLDFLCPGSSIALEFPIKAPMAGILFQ